MEVTRRTLLGVAVAGATLTAGCADDGTTPTGTDEGMPEQTEEQTETEAPEGTGTPTEEDTPTEDGTTEEESPTEETETPTDGESAATVQVGSHPDLGEILVGPEEMTLYMFDQDTQDAGESACGEGCMSNWPPLTVEEGEPEAGENVTAELSTFEREDGSMQVAANGWPLYQFVNDEEPGDANGQGSNDGWWVLGPDGSPVRSAGTPTGTGTSTPTESPNGTATPTDAPNGTATPTDAPNGTATDTPTPTESQ